MRGAADGRGAMKRFELLSIIGSMVAVGITLGAMVIASNVNLRAEMQGLRAEVNTEMQALRAEVRTDLRALEHRLAGVERHQARTEGLLEGLRDAITAQRRQDLPPARKEST